MVQFEPTHKVLDGVGLIACRIERRVHAELSLDVRAVRRQWPRIGVVHGCVRLRAQPFDPLVCDFHYRIDTGRPVWYPPVVRPEGVLTQPRGHWSMAALADRWDAGLGAVGALVTFVAGLLPWFRTATDATTGTEVVGPLVPVLALGALASLAVLDRTTESRLLLGTIGLATIGLVVLVYEGLTGGRGTVAVTWGGYLTLAGGASMAVAGSVPVLLEPAET